MRLLALLAIVASGPAFAQTCPAAPSDPVARDAARLNWGRPTAYTDGTSIPSSTTITYTVYERIGSNDTLRCTTTNTSAGQTGLSVGAHSWVVTAKVGTGPESAKTSAVTKNIPAPTPNPPANLTVDQGDATAWTIVTTEGAVVALEVGQVQPGTACDTSQSVRAFGRSETLYRVPESAVTFLPNQTALVTFASCSGG